MEVDIMEVKSTIKNVNTYNESSLFINLQDTMNRIETVISSTKTIDMERTYKTIKWVLRGHIKNNVNSLWIWEEDNFTCIYNEYAGNERIYTSNQLLRLLTQ